MTTLHETASWIEVCIVIIAFLATLISLVLTTIYLIDALRIWEGNLNGEIRRGVMRNLRNEALRFYQSAGFMWIGWMYMGVPPSSLAVNATAQITAGLLILSWCPLLLIWSVWNFHDRLKAWEQAHVEHTTTGATTTTTTDTSGGN